MANESGRLGYVPLATGDMQIGTALPNTSRTASTPRSLVSRRVTKIAGSKRMVSDQPGSPDTNLVSPLLTNLTDDQRKIIALCEVPRKQAYLMQATGLSHRTFFRHKRLDALIQARLVRITHPDEPNHPDQAYVVTVAGLALLNAWRTRAGRERD